MKQHLKQRLPFVLWWGLVFLVGFRLIDPSPGWEDYLVTVAVIAVAVAPDMVIWLRAKRSRTRGDGHSDARI